MLGCARCFAVAALNLLLIATAAAGSELGVSLYGLSYHPDRAMQDGTRFNELNTGAGVKYGFVEKRWVGVSVEAGAYDDSLGHLAMYGALSVKLRITRSFGAGVLVGPFQSESTNGGEVLLALVPAMSVRLGPVEANLTYLPAFRGVNDYPAFGAYLTFYPW